MLLTVKAIRKQLELVLNQLFFVYIIKPDKQKATNPTVLAKIPWIRLRKICSGFPVYCLYLLAYLLKPPTIPKATFQV